MFWHVPAQAVAGIQWPVSEYASFFFGVRIWLGTLLGRFSINYFRGLGLRIRVRVRVGVRVSVVIWSGQGKFSVRVTIRAKKRIIIRMPT